MGQLPNSLEFLFSVTVCNFSFGRKRWVGIEFVTEAPATTMVVKYSGTIFTSIIKTLNLWLKESNGLPMGKVDL